MRTGGQGRICAFSHFSTRVHGPTDRPTNQPTNRPTDIAGYKLTRTQNIKIEDDYFTRNELRRPRSAISSLVYDNDPRNVISPRGRRTNIKSQPVNRPTDRAEHELVHTRLCRNHTYSFSATDWRQRPSTWHAGLSASSCLESDS